MTIKVVVDFVIVVFDDLLLLLMLLLIEVKGRHFVDVSFLFKKKKKSVLGLVFFFRFKETSVGF